MGPDCSGFEHPAPLHGATVQLPGSHTPAKGIPDSTRVCLSVLERVMDPSVPVPPESLFWQAHIPPDSTKKLRIQCNTDAPPTVLLTDGAAVAVPPTSGAATGVPERLRAVGWRRWAVVGA